MSDAYIGFSATRGGHSTRLHTSSVRGGKNSNEKNVLPSLMVALILSTTFIVLSSDGNGCTNREQRVEGSYVCIS